MNRSPRLLILALGLLTLACEPSRSLRLSLELAAPSGGDACVIVAPEDLCTSVQVFAVGGDAPLALVGASGPDYALHFDRLPLPAIEADGGLPERVDVRVVLHERAGSARWAATLEDVDLAEPPPFVRLNPVGQWACASDLRPQPRALHGAVRVGPDQVLLFGGVTGADLDALSARDPEALGGPVAADSMELFDAARGLVEQVPIEGTPGYFRRVGFHAYVIEGGPGGATATTTIRVTGGYTAPASQPLLHFDNLGTRGPGGAALVPSRLAETVSDVDLVYDPASRTVTVVEVPPLSAVPRGGPITASAFLGSAASDPALALLGLAPAGTDYEVSALAYTFTRDGPLRAITLSTGRLGASVSALSDGFLIWGGNVESRDPRADQGGRLPSLDAATSPTPGPEGGPGATAFHSATALGGDELLIAGGWLISGDPPFATNLPSDMPVYVLDGSGPTLSARAVDASGHPSTTFHTATSVPGLGVLLVGGAVTEPEGAALATGNRLAPSVQVASTDGATFTQLADLAVARWGHATTPLGSDRVLVTGGFTGDVLGASAHAMATVAEAELLYVASPRTPSACE